MIGDRTDTDILLAHNARVASCLVFTGVIRDRKELEKAFKRDSRVKPTYIMKSFGILE